MEISLCAKCKAYMTSSSLTLKQFVASWLKFVSCFDLASPKCYRAVKKRLLLLQFTTTRFKARALHAQASYKSKLQSKVLAKEIHIGRYISKSARLLPKAKGLLYRPTRAHISKAGLRRNCAGCYIV